MVWVRMTSRQFSAAPDARTEIVMPASTAPDGVRVKHDQGPDWTRLPGPSVVETGSAYAPTVSHLAAVAPPVPSPGVPGRPHADSALTGTANGGGVVECVASGPAKVTAAATARTPPPTAAAV